MKNKFIRIVCEEGIKKNFSMIIPSVQITEKGLNKLIWIFAAKYILDDEEILSCLCKKNSIRYHCPININKGLIQSSGVSIYWSFVGENNLTEKEKEKINLSSSIKIK